MTPDRSSIEEKVLRAALIDIAAGKTTIGQAVQVARAALAALQGEAEAQIPPCRYPARPEEREDRTMNEATPEDVIADIRYDYESDLDRLGLTVLPKVPTEAMLAAMKWEYCKDGVTWERIYRAGVDAYQGEAEAQIPPCRYPVCMEEPGNPDPLTPEEAEAVAGILGGTVALVESLRPEAQEKYKRGAWWTAYEKLRALASTGRGDER